MDYNKIKQFQTTFKQKVNDDKLYEPIYKAFTKELRLIKPFLNEQSELLKKENSLFLASQKSIDEDYHILEEKYLRANHVIVEKNTEEILDQHRILLKKQKEIVSNHQVLVESYVDERAKLKETVDAKINEAKQKLHKELNHLEQTYKQFKRDDVSVVSDIQQEFQLTEQSLKHNFNLLKEKYAKQKITMQDEKTQVLAEIDTKIADEKNMNNNIYVEIKKVFNDANIEINQKINYLNKVYQRSLVKLDKSLDKLNAPITENIKILEDSYQSKIATLKKSYIDQLNALDLKFDKIHQNYEDKKTKILKSSQEAISIYNSKLANNRDLFESEKKQALQTYRKNIIGLDEKESEPFRKKMKSKIKQLESDFNKLILHTEKDINRMKKDYYQALHKHEIDYLNQRYQIRLDKLLLSHDYHHQVKKLDTNFKYNLEFANHKYILNGEASKSKKKILTYTLNEDMLPLETQMLIQSAVQERELNLLNYDQQIALNGFNINALEIEHHHEIELETLNHLETIEKQKLENELLVLNSNTQLELEKAKIKREFAKNDLEERKELASLIYTYQNLQQTYDVQQKHLEWQYLEKANRIETDYQKYLAKRRETLIYHQRTSFMRDADVKTKSRMQQNRAVKAIRNYRNDISLKQVELESMTQMLIFAYNRYMRIDQIIDQLYHLPAHPDAFKSLLQLFKSYLLEIDKLVEQKINDIRQSVHQYLEKEKLDVSRNKHAIKHETYQFFNQNNIDQYDIDINHFEQEIKQNEGLILDHVSKKERHLAFILQLEKISHTYKKLKQRDELKHNMALIKRHQHDLKQINHHIKTYEHEIKQHQKAIRKLRFRKSHTKKRMKKEDFLYQYRKKKDIKFYDKFDRSFKITYKKINQHYQMIKKSFDVYEQYIKNNVFITESQIVDAHEQIQKKLNAYAIHMIDDQQKHLKIMRQYVSSQFDKEAMIISEIGLQGTKSLKYLSQSSALFQKNMQKSFIEQKLLKNMRLTHEKDVYSKQRKDIFADYNFKRQQIKQNMHKQESMISKLSQELSLQLQTLNDNQHETALQYLNNSNDKLHALNQQHEKTIRSMKQRFDKTIGDISHHSFSLEKKNSNILEKYQQDIESLMTSMQSKKDQLHDKLSYENEKIKLMHESFQKTQKTAFKKRDHLFRQLKKENRIENRLSSKVEQKSLKKDIKEERQSFMFKTKSLKLDKVKR